MVLPATKAAKAPARPPASMKWTGDLMAHCPSCKSFETVWFDGGVLLSTRKYSQRGDLVYHDCGSARPCRLYRSS
jgi:hypothetical protein